MIPPDVRLCIYGLISRTHWTGSGNRREVAGVVVDARADWDGVTIRIRPDRQMLPKFGYHGGSTTRLIEPPPDLLLISSIA